MLDVNKLLSFHFFSKDVGRYQEIKKQLLKITTTLGSEDLMMYDEKIVIGPGPSTALIANSRHEDMIPRNLANDLKQSFKLIANTDLVCPKLMFVIIDSINDDLRKVQLKLQKMNEAFEHGIEVYFIGLVAEQHANIKLDNIADLGEHITNIISLLEDNHGF